MRNTEGERRAPKGGYINFGFSCVYGQKTRLPVNNYSRRKEATIDESDTKRYAPHSAQSKGFADI